MSDETMAATHERLTETRSWSEYDEDGVTLRAEHTTVREICGTCYREQIGRRGYLEYVSADWPCDGARVAALEAAGETMLDLLTGHTHGVMISPQAVRDVLGDWLAARSMAALTQADETTGGGAG